MPTLNINPFKKKDVDLPINSHNPLKFQDKNLGAIVYSLDFDGMLACGKLFRAQREAQIKSGVYNPEALTKAILADHKDYFDAIFQVAKDKNLPVVLRVGSSRQNVRNDLEHAALKATKHRELPVFSCFPIFECLETQLHKTYKVSVTLDKRLMGDSESEGSAFEKGKTLFVRKIFPVIANCFKEFPTAEKVLELKALPTNSSTPASNLTEQSIKNIGESFDKAIANESKNGDYEKSPLEDDSKFTYLYMQMHQAAAQFEREKPGKIVPFYFADDVGGKLKDLKTLFSQNPELIPHNIVLVLDHYVPSEEHLNAEGVMANPDEKPFERFVQSGTGRIDYNSQITGATIIDEWGSRGLNAALFATTSKGNYQNSFEGLGRKVEQLKAKLFIQANFKTPIQKQIEETAQLINKYADQMIKEIESKTRTRYMFSDDSSSPAAFAHAAKKKTQEIETRMQKILASEELSPSQKLTALNQLNSEIYLEAVKLAETPKNMEAYADKNANTPASTYDTYLGKKPSAYSQKKEEGQIPEVMDNYLLTLKSVKEGILPLQISDKVMTLAQDFTKNLQKIYPLELEKQTHSLPATKSTKTVALVDVDHCLVKSGDNGKALYNNDLINALKSQGITDIYLCSNFSLNNAEIKDRLDLIAHLAKEGIMVHGVIMGQDCVWNIDKETLQNSLEADTLHNSPLTKFLEEKIQWEDTTKVGYAFDMGVNGHSEDILITHPLSEHDNLAYTMNSKIYAERSATLHSNKQLRYEMFCGLEAKNWSNVIVFDDDVKHLKSAEAAGKKYNIPVSVVHVPFQGKIPNVDLPPIPKSQAEYEADIRTHFIKNPTAIPSPIPSIIATIDAEIAHIRSEAKWSIVADKLEARCKALENLKAAILSPENRKPYGQEIKNIGDLIDKWENSNNEQNKPIKELIDSQVFSKQSSTRAMLNSLKKTYGEFELSNPPEKYQPKYKPDVTVEHQSQQQAATQPQASQ